jgi:hypothetical protein
MGRYSIYCFVIIILLSSCEKVINVDLNSSDPAFVVEAVIYKDSVSLVRLTRTISYFSTDQPGLIEDASIKIDDGNSSEELIYKGNGYYVGKNIIGTEGKVYQVEILYNGKIYRGKSLMPVKAEIGYIQYSKSDSPGIMNPEGKTVFTIMCEFRDDPDINNYYMIQFISEGKLLERYYLLTENKSNSGSINSTTDDIIRFSESLFFDGGEVEVYLYSIDESVYNYFLQLSDILYWKRRVMPPTPYNPESNIDNNALGYFATWTCDSVKIMLQ